ncbi:MAG: cupredoxin domain-containing protein [Chloroflexia bacterium]|nr:cupredoxin domain-containing protein [Chloroflexia bacterium]
MQRAIRIFLFPAMLIAIFGAVIGGGLGVAQDTAGDPECPEASPAASPDASPIASPAGSPVADACATPTAGGNGEFTIEMVDIAFVPTELTIPADTEVTILLPNTGAALHNFNIDELDIHSTDAVAGETLSVTINAPAGEYEFYCDIPGTRPPA